MLTPPQLRSPDEPQRPLLEPPTSCAAAQRAQRLEAAALLLEQAIRAAKLADVDTLPLESVLQRLENQLADASARDGQRPAPRLRPKAQRDWRTEGPRPRHLLFIDESGGSRLDLSLDTPYFALGGVLMSESAYEDMKTRWNAWKVEWIGRDNASMHARSLTRRSIRHYATHGYPHEVLASLDALIDGFDFHLFVVAIDKAAFQRDYADGQTEAFLPGYHYQTCMDLLLERVVSCLLARDDAHAYVCAEARNRMQDAQVQMEYQRLQIEGTAFHAATWFRYQLGPHIAFQSKDDNIAGLQLVDVLLRAVVDKLTNPGTDPLRWAVAKKKLYAGEGQCILDWGLKVFPLWDLRIEI
ncbi:MAG: DUF3800 domain-containing protein [Chloroflexi bacterium]|nr:DUF3800 domain-containing protein [Chloroflexota bacterium]